MASSLRDVAGNALSCGDRVVVVGTGQLGKVIAVDHTKPAPARVKLTDTAHGLPVVNEVHWYRSEVLLWCPSSDQHPPGRLGVALADLCKCGSWVG